MLYQRRKLLLGLLEAFGGRLAATDFQKHLFMFCREHETDGMSYHFVPYRFGCFSFQSYADKRALIVEGWLEDSDDWMLKADIQSSARPPQKVRNALKRFHSHRGHLHGDELIADVYRRHPYYATRSEIATRLLTSREMKAVRDAQPRSAGISLFTIGYEGMSLDEYLNKLLVAGVRLLCDVRRNPISRKYGFSKSTLSHAVESLGIQYRHFPELGIHSEGRRALRTQADYDSLFKNYERTTLLRQNGELNELAALVEKYDRIALTCFEALPCQCHRTRVASAVGALRRCVMTPAVLITVKTYPSLSGKYGELVCTAGVDEDGRWVRIYPVPFRQLDEHQQYEKFRWLELDLTRNDRDARPESFRPTDYDSIQKRERINTEDGWAARRRLIVDRARIHRSLTDLIDEAKANYISLATFKPAAIHDLVVEPCKRDWPTDKLARLETEAKQTELFAQPFSPVRDLSRLVRKLPYKFSYRFSDNSGRESTLMIEDWEIGMLYWNCLHICEGDERAAIAKVRQKYVDDFAMTKDVYLFLGTTLEWHFRAMNPFIIIGVFAPPYQRQTLLDFGMDL